MGEVLSFPKATVNRARGRARRHEPLAEVCGIGKWSVCTFTPTHRHHLLPRSQGGSDAASNTSDVCASCHEYAHANPTESYLKGWLLHRGPST
jgi:hypothetical protein